MRQVSVVLVAVAAAVFLSACALFGGGDRERDAADKAFPNLGTPVATGSQNEGDGGSTADSEDRAAQIRRLEIRRVVAELERDVLDPALLEQLPAAPSLPRTPLIPRVLLRQSQDASQVPLAPAPSEMPPVLPAGGVPADRIEES